jgi:ATP-binding cassette subfamily C protein EexD
LQAFMQTPPDNRPALRRQEPLSESGDLSRALVACRSSFLFAGFFSLFVNLLLLVPSFYMLAVYDKVLASGSEATLLMLTLITVFLFVVMGGLEWVRSQILIATSTRLDQLLGGRVFDALFAQTLASGGRTGSAQPLGDLLQLRQFLTGPGLFAFFDAPWMPIYLVLMFLFHPWFGMLAVLSGLILAGLAVWNEWATQPGLAEANRESAEASQFTQRNLRNAEAVAAMGMQARLRGRWQTQQTRVLDLQARTSARAGLIAMLSKTYRLTIQSLVLGLGAYLSIHKEISPGLMIAGSILLGRALAPLDQMIANWRGFVQAREAFRRLDRLLQATPAAAPPMPLPDPTGQLSLEQVVVVPPGASDAVLKGISLELPAGTLLALIGPSGAGKSTLLRAILGLCPVARGSVRLDGAELKQWDREHLGRFIGYLPQDVELLDGTVSENIARFGEIDPAAVVAAAQAAGIHELILRLPEGYETRLASGGGILSAGQRQRLGLARALHGDPPLLVLDEPNSNLDQAGDLALLETLKALKRKGSTVLVVSHRANVLALVDRILMLADGQVALQGPRDEVLAALAQPPAPPGPAAAPTAAASAAGRPALGFGPVRIGPGGPPGRG